MTLFYGWCATVTRVQSHDKETVQFLPRSPQEFLLLSELNSEGWKAELTLEPPSGFRPRTLWLGIQLTINHQPLTTINHYNDWK